MLLGMTPASAGAGCPHMEQSPFGRPLDGDSAVSNRELTRGARGVGMSESGESLSALKAIW